MSRAGVAVERNTSIVMGRIYKLMFVPLTMLVLPVKSGVRSYGGLQNNESTLS